MKVEDIKNSIDKVNIDAVENSSAKLIPANSILMVIRSGILKKKLPVAINRVEVTVNQDMKAFIPNSNLITNEYLLNVFKASEPYLLGKVRAVTADNIEFKQIKDLKIPVPDLDLQEKFCKSIGKVKKQKSLLHHNIQKSESLFQSLLQKHLKGNWCLKINSNLHSMNSNFEFLHSEWSGLYENLKLAEQRVNTEPISVGTKCRLALEEAVHHIYQLEYIDLPFDTRLQALLNEPEIRNIIQAHQRTVDVIRKTGNNATHYNPKRVSKEDAKICLKHTFSFIKWFAETYSEVEPDVPLHFNEQLIPKVGAEGRKLQEQKKNLSKSENALKRKKKRF